ncbi:putative disease resistance protein RGA3 [Hordeum vulgare]|nr:putative disease resistance protein RGA3 [Hordeum vulgare]
MRSPSLRSTAIVECVPELAIMVAQNSISIAWSGPSLVLSSSRKTSIGLLLLLTFSQSIVTTKDLGNLLRVLAPPIEDVMMGEYDDFGNSRIVLMDKITIWAQVHKLQDNYLHEQIVRGVCCNMAEVMEVHVKLLVGFVGKFVRVRLRIKVGNKITLFVSMTRDMKREWYKVKYEKLPMFCGFYGLMGHWHEECGSGEHDEDSLERADFLLVDGSLGRSRGR